MTRPKPRIYKRNGSWWVELPAFGFSMVDVRYPFDTWRQAGRWLRQASIGASDGTVVEWAPTPHADWHWQWPAAHR